MDKKQLHALIDGIVKTVETDNGLTEAEARVFVGVALRLNQEAFLQTVVIPKLAVVTEEKAEEKAA